MEERKNYSKWRSRIEGVGNDGTINSNNNFGSVGSYGATSSDNYSSYKNFHGLRDFYYLIKQTSKINFKRK